MKVDVIQLTKQFKTERALDEISFSLKDDEILCVLGPSGSGKSTLLRCLCGLTEKSSGTILFNGQAAENIAAERWNISVVFDEPRLIDHLNVFDNISLGLKKKGWSKEKISQRTKEIAAELELSEYLERFPATLSAGQKQRTALGRSLVRGCDLLLLDEAFSNLDEALRKRMIELLLRLKKQYRFSCVLVTHSRYEARLLNAETLILDQGRILQKDSWENCLHFPRNEKVKSFLEE